MEETIEEVREQKDQAYWERNQLVLFLSRLFPSHLSKHSPRYLEDGTEIGTDWNTFVCVHLPTGQATWHIHREELEKYFWHLTLEPNHWDGHTVEEKYQRLNRVGTICI